MLRPLPAEDLTAHYLLTPSELSRIVALEEASQLGFAIQFKSLQLVGQFPASPQDIPNQVARFVADQLRVCPDQLGQYRFEGRVARHHRALIRRHLDFRPWQMADEQPLVSWLLTHILPGETNGIVIREEALCHLCHQGIEPPTGRFMTPTTTSLSSSRRAASK